jgi:hypothetical protein
MGGLWMNPTLLEWLSAASVPAAGWALKYANDVQARFIVLEALFNERRTVIDRLENQQKDDARELALHGQALAQVRADIAAINSKLEPLPRIAAMLESILPSLQNSIPRSELEHRFCNVEQSVAELKHLINQ